MYRVTNAAGIPGEELLFIPFRVGPVPTEITFISNVVNLQSPQNIRGRVFAGGAAHCVCYAAEAVNRLADRDPAGLHATSHRKIYALLIAVFLPRRVVAPLF